MNTSNLQHSPFKVAIIRSSAIGDVILSTSCLSLLSRWVPDAEIVWIGAEPSLSLIQFFFPAVKTVTLKQAPSQKPLWQELEGADLVLDLQTSLRTWWFGVLLKWRFFWQGRGALCRLPKHRIKRLALVLRSRLRGRSSHGYGGECPDFFHVAEEMAGLLGGALLAQKKILLSDLREALEQKLFYPSFSWRTEAKIPPPGAPSVAELPKDRLWIALAPGASFATKRAPLDVLEKILSDLSQRTEHAGKALGVVVLGDKNDVLMGEHIRTRAWGSHVMVQNLCGKLTLVQSGEALVQCRVLLSNDSALCHLGEALHVPVGVLFGPTHEAFGFSALRPKSRTFSRLDLGCRPCSRHGKASCRYGDLLCFRGIDTQAVTNYLESFL